MPFTNGTQTINKSMNGIVEYDDGEGGILSGGNLIADNAFTNNSYHIDTTINNLTLSENLYVHGKTISNVELSFLDDCSSNIQQQINNINDDTTLVNTGTGTTYFYPIFASGDGKQTFRVNLNDYTTGAVPFRFDLGSGVFQLPNLRLINSASIFGYLSAGGIYSPAFASLLGRESGRFVTTSQYVTAVGAFSGRFSPAFSLSLGAFANQNSTFRSICLNAQAGVPLDANANGFFAKPVRDFSSFTSNAFLQYNTSSGEIYSTTANIPATYLGDGSTGNTQLSYINSLTSNAQTQLNNLQSQISSLPNLLISNNSWSGTNTFQNTVNTTATNVVMNDTTILNSSSLKFARVINPTLGRATIFTGNDNYFYLRCDQDIGLRVNMGTTTIGTFSTSGLTLTNLNVLGTTSFTNLNVSGTTAFSDVSATGLTVSGTLTTNIQNSTTSTTTTLNSTTINNSGVITSSTIQTSGGIVSTTGLIQSGDGFSSPNGQMVYAFRRCRQVIIPSTPFTLSSQDLAEFYITQDGNKTILLPIPSLANIGLNVVVYNNGSSTTIQVEGGYYIMYEGSLLLTYNHNLSYRTATLQVVLMRAGASNNYVWAVLRT